jgi:cell wall-associated NlpC family hydrolase
MSSKKRAAVVASMVATIVASGISTATTAAASTTTLGSKALTVAKQQLGKPYLWGAAGPSKYDCSGLMIYSFKKVGKSIPRVAQDQYNKSTKISSSSRRLGDLIFFGTSKRNIVHVGMYMGNGNMVDADSGSYYGHRVTKEPVKGWFSQHYNVYYGRFA